MGLHRNAGLGLGGRRALVANIEAGCSCREAARRRGVSPTACKWWRRWLEASEQQRVTLACLEDRSSRPHRCPRLLPAIEQARICAARRRSGWGPRLIAGETGHRHATVWRTLRQAGISRPPRQPREQPRRYEWPCPGDLLHVDSKRFVRFTRPGHAVTGGPQRRREADASRLRVGALPGRRPLPLRLQRAPPRRASCDRDRLPRARPRAFRQPGDRSEAAALRQRLRLPPQPHARRAARPQRHPSPPDPDPPPPRSTARSSATSRRSNASGRSARPIRSSEHRAQALSH